MAKLITKDLAVCEACLVYIANGTTGDAEKDVKCAQACIKTLRYYDVPNGHLFPVGDENEKGFFSWRECDCCRDDKGGNRYMVGILAL